MKIYFILFVFHLSLQSAEKDIPKVTEGKKEDIKEIFDKDTKKKDEDKVSHQDKLEEKTEDEKSLDAKKISSKKTAAPPPPVATAVAASLESDTKAAVSETEEKEVKQKIGLKEEDKEEDKSSDEGLGVSSDEVSEGSQVSNCCESAHCMCTVFLNSTLKIAQQ